MVLCAWPWATRRSSLGVCVYRRYLSIPHSSLRSQPILSTSRTENPEKNIATPHDMSHLQKKPSRWMRSRPQPNVKDMTSNPNNSHAHYAMECPSLMTLVMPCLRALRVMRLALFSSSSWSPSASLFCHVLRGNSILQAALLLTLGLGWVNRHVRQPVVSENQQKHRAKLVLSPPSWIAFVSTVTWSSDDQLSSTTALSTSISFRCLYRALCALDHTSILSYTLIYHHLCVSQPLSSAPISSNRSSLYIPFHPRVSSPHHLSSYMYVYKGRSLRRPVPKICVVSSLCFILSFLYLLPLFRYPSLSILV